MLMNGGITGIERTQHAGHPGADVRRRHRLRRHVARVPVILMPRVQDVAQVGQHVRPDQRRPIHHAGNVLQPLANLDVVDNRVDRRKRAHHLFDRQPDFKRLIPLGIERLGRGHAARHPQQDARVGFRDRMLDARSRLICLQQLWLARHERGRPSRGQGLKKLAAASRPLRLAAAFDFECCNP